MTWVKGTTTWGATEHLIAQLACGEVADSNSTTVASGSRWVREESRTVTDGVTNSTTTITSATASFASGDVGLLVFGAGIPYGATIASVTNSTTAVLTAAATASASGVSLQFCTNAIRTPAVKDVSTGSCSNRAGYFANCGSGGYNLSGGATLGNDPARSSFAKVTAVATGAPTNITVTQGRWIVALSVTAANTVANNYSTASVNVQVADLDGLTTASTYAAAQILGPSSGGVISSTLYLGAGTSITVGDPSGFLTVGTVFVRAFTTTYLGGVDVWPMWYRSTVTSPTFSVAPPGTSATDYDVVSIATPAGMASVSSWSPNAYDTVFSNRSGWLFGLGIKTNTGLGSSALYTVSFPMALAKIRIYSTANGKLSLDVGLAKRDATSLTTMRNVSGYRNTAWLQAATTSASVLSTTAVQYWLSVTNDGIVVVLNIDSAATGKLGVGYVTSYTPQDATYDVFPVMYNPLLLDCTTGVSSTSYFSHTTTQYPYLSLRRRQDGSEGTRDWQTRWMRCEHYYASSVGQYGGNGGGYSTGGQYHSGSWYTDDLAPVQLSYAGVLTGYNSNYQSMNNPLPARQVKPNFDGKWWMYGYTLDEGSFNPVLGNGQFVDENRFIRGLANTRFFFLPADGWGSGDELTDSGSGAKYFLLTPDYAPYGMPRMAGNSGSFGGVAIAEL